jgi:hypothetical protein
VVFRFIPDDYIPKPTWPNKKAAPHMGESWNAVWALAVKRGDLAEVKGMLKEELVCIHSSIIDIGILE